jgi:hypothetical protein
MKYRVIERSSERNVYEIEAESPAAAMALVEDGDCPDPVYNNIDLSEVVSAEPITDGSA